MALHCGRWDWWRIEEELSARDIAILQAYSEIEPWGDRRADIRAALNTSMSVAPHCREMPDVSPLMEYPDEIAGNSVDHVMSPNAAAAVVSRHYRRGQK